MNREDWIIGIKMHRIVSLLLDYENVIVNSNSMDEYEVTYEDIHKIAESIIDDIQWDSFEAIQEYIDKYIGKNKYFDLA